MATRGLTVPLLAALAGPIIIVVLAAGTLLAAGGSIGPCAATAGPGSAPWVDASGVNASRISEPIVADGPPSASASASVDAAASSAPAILDVTGWDGDVNGCAGGGAVLARAAIWLTAWGGGPVPYLSSGDPSTWFGGYRRDCSGYASMALGLPGPGLDTAALAAHSVPIAKADLRAGDLLINPGTGSAGHVVVFDRWVDATMTQYLGYEQAGDGGTHHRAIPYPYFRGYPMTPYRYSTFAGSSTPVPANPTTP